MFHCVIRGPNFPFSSSGHLAPHQCSGFWSWANLAILEKFWCNVKTSRAERAKCHDDVGSRGPLKGPGGVRAVVSLTVPCGQEFYLPHFFHQTLINFSCFSSNFSHFLTHFGLPGGRVAHPGRPWLRHWVGSKGLSPWKLLGFSVLWGPKTVLTSTLFVQ